MNESFIEAKLKRAKRENQKKMVKKNSRMLKKLKKKSRKNLNVKEINGQR